MIFSWYINMHLLGLLDLWNRCLHNGRLQPITVSKSSARAKSGETATNMPRLGPNFAATTKMKPFPQTRLLRPHIRWISSLGIFFYTFLAQSFFKQYDKVWANLWCRCPSGSPQVEKNFSSGAVTTTRRRQVEQRSAQGEDVVRRKRTFSELLLLLTLHLAATRGIAGAMNFEQLAASVCINCHLGLKSAFLTELCLLSVPPVDAISHRELVAWLVVLWCYYKGKINLIICFHKRQNQNVHLYLQLFISW